MSDEACGKDRKRLSVMLAEAVLEFVGDKGAKSATKLYIRELHCSYRAFHPTIHVSSSRSYIQSLIINLIDSLQEDRFLEANDIENLKAIRLHRTALILRPEGHPDRRSSAQITRFACKGAIANKARFVVWNKPSRLR